MGSLILAAFDRDPTGELQSDRLEMHARVAEVELRRDAPPEECKDWNEAVCVAHSQRAAAEETPSLSAPEWERQVMLAVNMEDESEIRRLLEYGRAHFDLADGFIDETIRYAERHLLGEDIHQ